MADSPLPEALAIRASRYEYRVDFVTDYADVLERTFGPDDFLIVDRNVLLAHERLRRSVASFPQIVIDPSEEAKSFGQLAPVIEELIQRRFTKKGRLVAVGGGIVQDITAFTASVLYRGVGWVFFPTSLLAQCDSCIGSKTSINVGPYKNQLGNFWPPRSVFIDLAFLATLDEREIRSGIGEMMHYFLLTGEADVRWAEQNLTRAFSDQSTLTRMIQRSLSIKKAMVERDEFDEGPRNVFNYGHSFGHALESTTNYEVPHGIAVSFGMDIANCISSRKGLIGIETRNRLRALLSGVWGNVSLKHVDSDKFIAALSRDKKNEGSDVKVILTKGIGQMFKTTLPLDTETRQFLASYFMDEIYRADL
jgi:3-dehydroquinate synthase